jgi:hypothetical protein
MSFLQAEKRRQTEWKLATGDLTRSARRPGLFGNRLFPFCLPVDDSPQNLWFGIRDEILEYFQDNRIVWHTGALPGYPSNHLCSSQVFLVNFLAPFQSRREVLLQLFLPVFPDLTSILPIEAEDRFLAFEWVPPEDLLGESRSGPWGSGLTRGVGNTSIDFVFLGRTSGGTTVLVLGEAKYTEHYPVQGVDLPRASKRLERYAPLIRRCSWLPDLTGDQLQRLASEPVYQVLRHHLLAIRLVGSYEPIDEVRLVHLYVERRGSGIGGSPVLRPHPGMELLAMSPIPFAEVSVQDLFRGVRDGLPADLADWSRYMVDRYRL